MQDIVARIAASPNRELWLDLNSFMRNERLLAQAESDGLIKNIQSALYEDMYGYTLTKMGEREMGLGNSFSVMEYLRHWTRRKPK